MEVSTEQVKRFVEHGGAILVDVRDPDELSNGIIPGARNIPVGELADALQISSQAFRHKYGFERFSKSDLVVFYCRTGGRSSYACGLARSLGYRVANYPGSIQAWSRIDSSVKMY